ncbi:hypothetical protein AKO1_009508, partial [Acrasis kona]
YSAIQQFSKSFTKTFFERITSLLQTHFIYCDLLYHIVDDLQSQKPNPTVFICETSILHQMYTLLQNNKTLETIVPLMWTIVLVIPTLVTKQKTFDESRSLSLVQICNLFKMIVNDWSGFVLDHEDHGKTEEKREYHNGAIRQSLRACLREFCRTCYALMPCTFISQINHPETPKKTVQMVEQFLLDVPFHPFLLHGSDPIDTDPDYWLRNHPLDVLMKYKCHDDQKSDGQPVTSISRLSIHSDEDVQFDSNYAQSSMADLDRMFHDHTPRQVWWQRLITLQSWIYIFFTNESHHIKRDVQFTSDVSHLQRNLLLCRNELLYERYLRREMQLHVNDLKNDRMDNWLNESRVHTMNKKIKQQVLEIQRLQEQVIIWRKTDLDSRNKVHHFDDVLTHQINTLESNQRKLTEENLNLNEYIDTLKYQMQKLDKELQEKRDMIYQLKTQQTENLSRIEKYKEKESHTERLMEEVHLWERSHSEFLATSKQNEELIQGIVFRDKINDAITTKLDKTREKIHQISSSLHTNNALIQDLKKEAKDSNELLRREKTLLEHQCMLGQEKVQAVQTKYDRLKALNLALQRKIIDMRSEQESKQNTS